MEDKRDKNKDGEVISVSGDKSPQSQKRDSDKLGTEPVHGLLLKTSAPLMVSMFVMALYNIVDSIYLGHYNTDSLTAVSLCFPFQNLNVAFGIGTAVGMSALLSRYLGAKQYARADKVAHNGFILAAINYSIFFIVGCLAEPIMRLVTAGSVNEFTLSEATSYLRITQWLSIAPMMQSMFERLLQGTGKTKYISYMQLSATLFNVVVDPILIFGYFGLPAMGAKGAALATVFGQLLGCILGHIFNREYNKEIQLSLKKVRPHLRTMKDIYKIGSEGHFDSTCQETVPWAIRCFLESESFEDAIRIAVMARGDTDTKAAICGSIAEAYYEIPEELVDKAFTYLPDDMLDIVTQFYDAIVKDIEG